MSYERVREQVRDGDLIAVRSTHSGFARLVRLITRSPYTHTGIALWLDGGLWVSEMDGSKNVLVPLSQYESKPFDVLACPVDRAAVRVTILELLRGRIEYDWMEVIAIGARHLLGIRLEQSERRKVCNSYSAAIYVAAGWKTEVPELISPGELVALLGKPITSHDP